MIRKGGIFLQTFLWFWIVVTTVVATLYALHEMTETTSRETRIREHARTAVTFFGQIALEHYEHGDIEGLMGISNRLKSSTGIEAYLFDEKGAEVTGLVAPPEAASLAARTDKDGTIAVSVSHEKGIVAGMSIFGADKTRYVVVASTPDSHPVLGETLIWTLRVIVVFIISSIACYLLSRRMTRPIVKLREAATQLALGDLTVRVAPAVGARGDEIGELARDFDVMAARIEAVLTSQRQLLGNISHELRSPLARLGVALELAGRHSSTEAQRYLNRIELEAERLNELIGRLLAFARLESSMDDFKKEPFDLAEIVGEVAGDADFEAQGAGKTVRVAESRTCVVSGIRELLRSAIENVVRNAVQHTREGTEVEIALRYANSVHGSSAIITVRDHGPGVPRDDLEKLFRPFYRVGGGRERRTGGAGLGLAITEGAIRLHNGAVHAANAPDGGLLVELRIPMTT